MEKPESPFEFLSSGLVCDNPECEWKDDSITIDNFHDWVNAPCPLCGWNLLNDEDYKNAMILEGVAAVMKDMSQETMDAIMKNVDLSELLKHPIFEGTKGLENIEANTPAVMTISTAGGIRIVEVKKDE